MSMDDAIKKKDLYYVTYLLSAEILTVTCLLLITQGELAWSLFMIAMAIVAYSLGVGTMYEGRHRRFWGVIFNE